MLYESHRVLPFARTTVMPVKKASSIQLPASSLAKRAKDPLQCAKLFKEYISQGFQLEALRMYANLPRRSREPFLHSVLKLCGSFSVLPLGQSLHGESIKVGKDHELLMGTSFVSMYCKCRHVTDARKMFNEMPDKNAVTYNAMIQGYLKDGDVKLALSLFDRMPARTPVTWAEMIDGHMRIGDTIEARRLFDQMPDKMRTVVSWTVMIHGYTINSEMDAARKLFDQMPARNCFVWSSMITGYFKNGNAEEAQAMFDQIPVRNLVNWNSLIAGYTQNGVCEKALAAYRQMQEDGFEPDEFTIASVLSACGQLGWLHYGIDTHDLLNRKKIKLNHFVLNGLIDMYAKCGDIEGARKIFDGMGRKNITCWNSMISGLASHGYSEEALKLFAMMEESDEKPNDITFLAILSACTHGGLVQKGLEVFAKMDKYGVVAGVKHYGCLIDLLGRSGRLAEAHEMIKKMPLVPNEVVYGALLGACKLHANRDIADQVVHHVFNLNSVAESCKHAPYVVLANVYAASEKWQEAERVRRTLQESGIKKLPGCSSVIVGDKEYMFHAGAVSKIKIKLQDLREF